MAKQLMQGRGRGTDSRGSKVYEALLQRIRTRELLPRTRIREEEVAALLGVSRTPVREALTRLQARGLVVASQNGLALAELSHAQTMELYALRSVLEGAAARFAAENASQAEIAGLQLLHERFVALGGPASEFARLNILFHEAIHEAAHNRYLSRTMQELHDSLALLPDTTFAHPSRPQDAKSEHAQILEGIVMRRPDMAERAAREHIDRARDVRLSMLFNAL